MKHEIQTCIDCLQSAKCKYIRTIDYQAIGSNKIQRESNNEIRRSNSKYGHLFSRRHNHHTFGKRSAQFQCFPCCFCDLPIPLSPKTTSESSIQKTTSSSMKLSTTRKSSSRDKTQSIIIEFELPK